MLHKMSDGSFFYHIPKTGGRAFKQFNSKNGENDIKAYSKNEDHARDAYVLKNVPPNHTYVSSAQAKGKIIRAVIRDPVDRFLSSYYFTKKCSVFGPHQKNKGVLQVKGWKHCPNWGKSPLDMISKIKEQVSDIDKLGFFHFNTQHKWHQHLNPDNMIYIDFRDLNFKQRLHVVKNNEPDTDRPPLAEQEGLSEIACIARELYEKDYEYFESIPWISDITDSWL